MKIKTKPVSRHVRINGESFVSIEHRGHIIMLHTAAIARKFTAAQMSR